MKGQDLVLFIESIPSLKPFFKGVFSINTMPKSLKKREFFISNTDLSSESGSHWICLIKNDSNELELFDSLGIDDQKLERFLNFLVIRNKKRLIYNVTPVQGTESSSCGLFVLYFLVKRLFNIDLSFNNVINRVFDADPNLNENIVQTFINEI